MKQVSGRHLARIVAQRSWHNHPLKAGLLHALMKLDEKRIQKGLGVCLAKG